jgi:cell division protein FtsN
MSEQDFHEIQLGRKQIVFLFMAAVVVAVGVFLLGVSFGRTVQTPASAAAADTSAPSDTSVAVVPPPTETRPGDLTYHSTLQGQPAPTSTPALEPTPASEPTSTPVAAPPPVATPTPTPTPAEPPAAPAAEPVRPEKPAVDPSARAADASRTPAMPAASPRGRYALQVGAFSTQQSADRVAAQLKAKRFPSSIVIGPPSEPGARFHVIVGPYATRADAQKVIALLDKEGIASFIKR